MGRAAKLRKRARQRAKQKKHGMVQTKRTATNKKKHSTKVGWEVRKQNRAKYFKCKCRGE